jgi:hypothetical protein
MAGLQHGIATVTTRGPLTEAVWTDSQAAALASVDDAATYARQVAELLRDPQTRTALGCRAADVYRNHFSIEHTLAVLRGVPAATL